MIRHDWTQPLPKSEILDLSNNVCYDKFLDRNFEHSVSTYPDDAEAYRLLSQYYNISPYNIAIGYGSSDIILRILKLYQGNSLKIVNPTWQLAQLYAHHIGYEIKDDADILYIANPNGLTGKALSKNEILSLLTTYKLVIVDEAYCDFSDCSVLDTSITADNLIVVKTLSKTIASPGLRFGYCFSNLDIINRIQNVRPGYVTTSATIPALNKLLPQIGMHISRMLETRNYIEDKYDVVPSEGNYVLFKTKHNLPVKMKEVNDLFRMSLTDIDTFKKFENELR